MCRSMLGPTNPADANPGTIRGDFSVQTGRQAQWKIEELTFLITIKIKNGKVCYKWFFQYE